VIHKRILDAAESDPSASMADIASGIGGASTELVEKVLDQYGDPATEEQSDEDDASEREEQEEAAQSGGEKMDTGEDLNGTSASTGDGPEIEEKVRSGDEEADANANRPSVEDYEGLTEGQVRALRLVERNPDAPQSDIAAEFDVTRATISRWLSDIPGFEWSRRAELATRILDDGIPEADERTVSEESGSEEPGAEESGAGDREPDPGRESDRRDELDRRLGAIERRLERLENGSDAEADATTETDTGAGTDAGAGVGVGGLDPDLAHRVVHACLHSDRISEEEELRILKELLG
jgi:transcriptional regulator with XRE-family HTH domain